jgi:hypothetical protein
VRFPRLRPIPGQMTPTSVVLERDGVEQPAQDFYLYWGAQARTPQMRELPGGRQVEIKLHLIGDQDTDAEVGDLFSLSGGRYEVVFVRPPQGGVMRVIECTTYG